MTLGDLFNQCTDHDIELIADGVNLIVEGDADLLSADALNLLRSRKAEILAALNEPADRRTCLQSGADRGYPSVSIRPGERLLAGGDAWEKFTSRACINDVRRVAADLCMLDQQSSENQ